MTTLTLTSAQVPDLKPDALIAGLPEPAKADKLPKSIMLIASTDIEVVNRCTELFFNHAAGRCSYQSPGHVGEVYDPEKHIHSVLMNTEELYSEDFLFSTLLMIEDEIGEPGCMERDYPSPETNNPTTV